MGNSFISRIWCPCLVFFNSASNQPWIKRRLTIYYKKECKPFSRSLSSHVQMQLQLQQHRSLFLCKILFNFLIRMAICISRYSIDMQVYIQHAEIDFDLLFILCFVLKVFFCLNIYLFKCYKWFYVIHVFNCFSKNTWNSVVWDIKLDLSIIVYHFCN